MNPIKAIICVDDESIILKSLEAQLSRFFGDEYTIEMAESAEEGLEIIEEITEEGGDIPLVISDQIMPGMKGNEFLAKVHELMPDTLKVLLTGQADVTAVGDAVNNAKLYRYIAKPWEQSDFVMTVQEALKSFFQTKQIASQNQQLKKYNEQLEDMVEQRTKELQQEKEKTELLLQKIQTLFGQHVSTEVATELISADTSSSESKIYQATILFLDIREFTVFADSRPPAEVAKFQNIVFGELINIVRRHKGIVNQLLGDGLMAVFGAPVINQTHVQDAVNASLDMVKAVNELHQQGHIPEIKVGIGVHTGKIIAGELGNEYRKLYSLTGSNVIVASRIEQLNKELVSQCLISEDVYSLIDDTLKAQAQPKGEHLLKGIANPVAIYQLA